MVSIPSGNGSCNNFGWFGTGAGDGEGLGVTDGGVGVGAGVGDGAGMSLVSVHSEKACSGLQDEIEVCAMVHL